MNWVQIQGKWKQSVGKIKEKWGQLTHDDSNVIAGKRDQLVGAIQERYGIAKDSAEKQVDEFLRTCNEADMRRCSNKENSPEAMRNPKHLN